MLTFDIGVSVMWIIMVFYSHKTCAANYGADPITRKKVAKKINIYLFYIIFIFVCVGHTIASFI